MKRFDHLIGNTRERVALDVDLARQEVVLVLSQGREYHLDSEDAHQLAVGLIKAVDMLRQEAVRRHG